jgi:hypothetical protein
MDGLQLIVGYKGCSEGGGCLLAFKRWCVGCLLTFDTDCVASLLLQAVKAGHKQYRTCFSATQVRINATA